MAHTMKPEQTRHERFVEYAAALRERLASGVLSELQPLSQWVVWKGELEAGKRKKAPYNPNYRTARASVKIPKSWGSEEIVQSLSSYTEASPGNGLHILANGRLPGKNIHTEIEMYGQDRFTTITTDHLPGTPTSIEHRQEAINGLYNRFAPPVREIDHQNTRLGGGKGEALTELPPEAEHDAVLQRLLAGDITGYKSQSNADFVLVLKLLHWTGDNVELHHGADL